MNTGVKLPEMTLDLTGDDFLGVAREEFVKSIKQFLKVTKKERKEGRSGRRLLTLTNPDPDSSASLAKGVRTARRPVPSSGKLTPPTTYFSSLGGGRDVPRLHHHQARLRVRCYPTTVLYCS